MRPAAIPAWRGETQVGRAAPPRAACLVLSMEEDGGVVGVEAGTRRGAVDEGLEVQRRAGTRDRVADRDLLPGGGESDLIRRLAEQRSAGRVVAEPHCKRVSGCGASLPRCCRCTFRQKSA